MAPEFIEVRGCVLRSGQFTSETLQGFWNATNGNISAIESAINHLHLWDVVAADTDVEHIQTELLKAAEAIASTWRAALALAFPDRLFEVLVTDDYGPTVTCFTVGAPRRREDGS